MHEVRFIPSGKVSFAREGTTIWTAALEGGMPLASSCGGEGVCRACRVRVIDGAEHLTQPDPLERAAAQKDGFRADERLACLARIQGPVVITTSYW